jgi:hypothetical protein
MFVDRIVAHIRGCTAAEQSGAGCAAGTGRGIVCCGLPDDDRSALARCSLDEGKPPPETGGRAPCATPTPPPAGGPHVRRRGSPPACARTTRSLPLSGACACAPGPGVRPPARVRESFDRRSQWPLGAALPLQLDDDRTTVAGQREQIDVPGGARRCVTAASTRCAALPTTASMEASTRSRSRRAASRCRRGLPARPPRTAGRRVAACR